MSNFLGEAWWFLSALIPSIGLLFLFWVILKHILEGDRRERAALREWEAAQDREAAARGREEKAAEASSAPSPEKP
ncbi:hypothetical protein [Ornithinimicrobium panacihumi]|uniref:hypothetical protein n=1 Tax=Ornithinimicrobium panacihumi TaxID=2008449 RepID=UPI003F8C4EC6